MIGRCTVALALLLGTASAAASGFRVAPVRLDLSARQPAGEIELTNAGAAKLAIQVSAFAWTQEGGRDVYVPSKDIFFAPPIVSVPGNGKALVRFRLRAAADKSVERAYRIYFQEVTPPESQQGGMRFRLRVGVPLFVAAIKPTVPTLVLRPTQVAEGLAVTLQNTGTRTLKIEALELFDRAVDREAPASGPVAVGTSADSGARYLLPGSQQGWLVPLPPSATLSKYVLRLQTNDYSGRVAPGATPRGWVWHDLGTPPGDGGT